MAIIGGNQITSGNQIQIPSIAKALKEAGFHVTVPKDQQTPTLVVKEYQKSLHFYFNKKYGGNVEVVDETRHPILSDYRTMKTLTEGVVQYFVSRRRNEVKIIIGVYKMMEDPELKTHGMQNLAKWKKRMGGRSQYIISFAKKQMKEDERTESLREPTGRRLKWGSWFILTKKFSSQSKALIAGKSYERKRHVCFIENFGKKSSPVFVLYVSEQLLPPHVKNPYKLEGTSKEYK